MQLRIHTQPIVTHTCDNIYGWLWEQYATFHHSLILQGSVGVLVFNGLTQQLSIMRNDFVFTSSFFQSRDSIVGIATTYWLDDRGVRV
jgi:hypothetical protein